MKKDEEESESEEEGGSLGQFHIEPLEEVGEGNFHFSTGDFFLNVFWVKLFQ